MRWKKTNIKNQANILKEKIKNIDATNEQIAKKTNTSRSVVSRVLSEKLGKVGQKSEYIARLIDADKEVMDLANNIILKHLKKLEKSYQIKTHEIKTISDIAEKSFKRYTLLKWNVTDNEWGLKTLQDFKNLSDDDLLKMI